MVLLASAFLSIPYPVCLQNCKICLICNSDVFYAKDENGKRNLSFIKSTNKIQSQSTSDQTGPGSNMWRNCMLQIEISKLNKALKRS